MDSPLGAAHLVGALIALVGIATFMMAGVASVLINRNSKPVTRRYGVES